MKRAAPDRTRLALGVIVVVALAVRLWAIDFGLPHVRVRPDELYILGAVIKMHAGQTNPGFFDYGGLYLYFVAGLYSLYYAFLLLMGEVTGTAAFVTRFSQQWEPFFLIPRVTSAVVGAATTLLVYAAGSRLLDRRTGIVSALFLALAFLHVRDSHYATTDVVMTFFVMGAVVVAIRVGERRERQDAWLAGALAGCAASTKYHAVLVTLVLAVVEVVHAWERRGGWRRALHETHIFRMAAGCLLVFVATNPYFFLDFSRAWENLRALQASTSGGMTPPDWLGRGWTYHLPFSLRHGMGIPLVLTALAGMGMAALRHPRAAVLLGTFPVAYYALVGAGYNVFVRYMVPVVPFLCIFAAYAVTQGGRAVAGAMSRDVSKGLTAVIGAAVIAPSAWSVVRFDYLLGQEDSRLIAARWVHEQVPPGSSILTGGNLYGHPQLERGPIATYRHIGFDRRAQIFTADGKPANERPEWILIQRHPIPYANPAPPLWEIVQREYELVHTIRAFDPSVYNFYDIQDGFYAPFGGFRGVRRFGPNYEIYRRRLASNEGDRPPP